MRIKFHARQQRSTDTLIIMIISNLKKQMFNCFFLSSLQPSSLPRSSPKKLCNPPKSFEPSPLPPPPPEAVIHDWLFIFPRKVSIFRRLQVFPRLLSLFKKIFTFVMSHLPSNPTTEMYFRGIFSNGHVYLIDAI